MLGERFRQGIAEAGAANIEPVAALHEQAPDPAGGRMFLVQNDENRCLGSPPRHRSDPTGGVREEKGAITRRHGSIIQDKAHHPQGG
jgi:hypothetical protein